MDPVKRLIYFVAFVGNVKCALQGVNPVDAGEGMMRGNVIVAKVDGGEHRRVMVGHGARADHQRGIGDVGLGFSVVLHQCYGGECHVCFPPGLRKVSGSANFYLAYDESATNRSDPSLAVDGLRRTLRRWFAS